LRSLHLVSTKKDGYYSVSANHCFFGTESTDRFDINSLIRMLTLGFICSLANITVVRDKFSCWKKRNLKMALPKEDTFYLMVPCVLTKRCNSILSLLLIAI